MGFWKNAFAIDHEAERTFTDEEKALVDKLARMVVERGMAVPGILFVETVKPLNFIGSQTLAFFEPIVKALFSGVDYEKFRAILERRGSGDLLLSAIEKAEAERGSKMKEMQAQRPPGRLARLWKRLRR